MAIFQNAVGKRQVTPPVPYTSGQVTVARFTYSFATAFTAASDKLELGILPAGARVVDYLILPTGMNGDCDIGIMSGTPGDPDNARTVGDEFFDGVTLASAVVRGSDPLAWKLAPAATDRAIGFINSANITADAAKTIELIVMYELP